VKTVSSSGLRFREETTNNGPVGVACSPAQGQRAQRNTADPFLHDHVVVYNTNSYVNVEVFRHVSQVVVVTSKIWSEGR